MPAGRVRKPHSGTRYLRSTKRIRILAFFAASATTAATDATNFQMSPSTASLQCQTNPLFDAGHIRANLTKFRRWLKLGGGVFLVNDAIYRTVFKPLISVYETQIAAGDEWPGFIKNVGACIPEYLHPETFQKTMNFINPLVLTRELNRAGFKVVTIGFYPYTGNFAFSRLDGRGIAAGIGLNE
jgi:hypothetical protein